MDPRIGTCSQRSENAKRARGSASTLLVEPERGFRKRSEGLGPVPRSAAQLAHVHLGRVSPGDLALGLAAAARRSCLPAPPLGTNGGNSLIARLKRVVRWAAYETGVLGAIHRLKNRNHLTVVMFHRVLSRGDPRWAGADPEYTVSDALFAGALEFLRRHYSIISLNDLFAALDGASLPPRPLLITLDDGWADTAEYALPALRRLGLPAAVFVAAGAIGRREAFWEERLYAAWRRHRVTVAELQQRAGWHPEPSDRRLPLDNSEPALRSLVTALGRAPEAVRSDLLATLDDVPEEPPYMLSADQLRLLASNGVTVGIHGYSHVALTDVDAVAELTRAHSHLRNLLNGVGQASLKALSFPHGSYDAAVIRDAVACGFALLFTSDALLTPLSRARRLTCRLLGRIDIPASAITTRDDRLDRARLATWLFPRRAARLSLEPGLASAKTGCGRRSPN